MASTDDYFRNAVIRASSPNEMIHAQITGSTDLEIWFEPRTFDRFDEADLAHQLARLAQTLWVAHQRERDAAYRTATGLSTDEAITARSIADDDPQRSAYNEALNQVEGEGVSADGSIRIRTRGMLSWTFDVAPEAPRRLGEDAFVSQVRSAYRSLLADRELKISVLKADHFDMGIPRAWREKMAELRAINGRS